MRQSKDNSNPASASSRAEPLSALPVVPGNSNDSPGNTRGHQTACTSQLASHAPAHGIPGGHTTSKRGNPIYLHALDPQRRQHFSTEMQRQATQPDAPSIGFFRPPQSLIIESQRTTVETPAQPRLSLQPDEWSIIDVGFRPSPPQGQSRLPTSYNINMQAQHEPLQSSVQYPLEVHQKVPRRSAQHSQREMPRMSSPNHSYIHSQMLADVQRESARGVGQAYSPLVPQMFAYAQQQSFLGNAEVQKVPHRSPQYHSPMSPQTFTYAQQDLARSIAENHPQTNLSMLAQVHQQQLPRGNPQYRPPTRPRLPMQTQQKTLHGDVQVQQGMQGRSHQFNAPRSHQIFTQVQQELPTRQAQVHSPIRHQYHVQAQQQPPRKVAQTDTTLKKPSNLLTTPKARALMGPPGSELTRKIIEKNKQREAQIKAKPNPRKRKAEEARPNKDAAGSVVGKKPRLSEYQTQGGVSLPGVNLNDNALLHGVNVGDVKVNDTLKCTRLSGGDDFSLSPFGGAIDLQPIPPTEAVFEPLFETPVVPNSVVEAEHRALVPVEVVQVEVGGFRQAPELLFPTEEHAELLWQIHNTEG